MLDLTGARWWPPTRSGHGPAQPVEQRGEAADHLGQAIGRRRVVECPFDGVQELAADVSSVDVGEVSPAVAEGVTGTSVGDGG